MNLLAQFLDFFNLSTLILFSVVGVLVFLGLKLLAKLSARYLKRLPHFPPLLSATINEEVGRLSSVLYFTVSFYVASLVVQLPPDLMEIVSKASLLIVVFYITRLIQQVLKVGVYVLVQKNQNEGGADESTIETIIYLSLSSLLWMFAFSIVLQGFGVQVSAFIGAMGVTAIIVGFGLQEILADIFAFFSIYFDKPFKIGDYVKVDTESGTVKQIGIKSTRLKSLSGEELIVSNKRLTDSVLRNYKRAETRRVDMSFGIVYGTSSRQIKNILEQVEAMFLDLEKTEFKRVHFTELGDYSLKFELVFELNSRNYVLYMDTVQAINLGLMQIMEKEKVEFAYPTQTVLEGRQKQRLQDINERQR